MRFGSDASLKGEGLDVSEPELPERTNVVDLMAALKKSLGLVAEERNRWQRRKRLPPGPHQRGRLRPQRLGASGPEPPSPSCSQRRSRIS
jgi:hypothetical protein